MTNYNERLDEILTRLENQVAIDVTRRVLAHKSGQSPKGSHLEAKQAIDRLFLEVVGEDLPTDIYGSWTRRANGSMLPLSDEVVITNKVKQQLRTTITGKEGE